VDEPRGGGSRWLPSPRRLARLLAGQFLFGAGEALMVASELGNTPWTVLAEGVAVHSGLGLGLATIAVSGVILAMWLPLRQRPGVGTVLNAIIVGLAIDAVLTVVHTPASDLARAAMLVAGTALIAVGSGLYLTTFLGAGPRDGLMAGLHRRTGRPIGLIRTVLEGGALTGGWLLGGTLGIGTLAFAVTIGPAVGAILHLMARDSLHHL
jgi:uncharacterized membrane protein YczE